MRELCYLVSVKNKAWDTPYVVKHGKQVLGEVSRMGAVLRFYKDGVEVFKHGVPPPTDRRQNPHDAINYMILRDAFDEKTAQTFCAHPALDLTPCGSGTTSYTVGELFEYLLDIQKDDNNDSQWAIRT